MRVKLWLYQPQKIWIGKPFSTIWIQIFVFLSLLLIIDNSICVAMKQKCEWLEPFWSALNGSRLLKTVMAGLGIGNGAICMSLGHYDVRLAPSCTLACNKDLLRYGQNTPSNLIFWNFNLGGKRLRKDPRNTLCVDYYAQIDPLSR